MYSQAKSIPLGPLNLTWITPAKVFIISTMIVNAGNYIYNLSLGRYLNPSEFAEAGFVVTLLLICSFLGMTFQIVSAKYSIDLEGLELVSFRKWISNLGVYTGSFLAFCIICFNQELTTFFNLSDFTTLPILVIALPIYFIMSVKRGFLQGQENFISLSWSYQIETWGRFAMTILCFLFYKGQVGSSVALAIVISIMGAYLIILKKEYIVSTVNALNPKLKRTIIQFFFITAAYEIAQVIINYGDLLIVKHYFDNHQAGLYTSLSLIGKMIYFITWMIVMILIPQVLKLRKQGLDYKKLMMKYLRYIICFTASFTLLTFIFPEFIVANFFGESYMEISIYIWKYVLVTSLFALSNIFVYYFLTLEQYKPVFIAIIVGVLQILACTFYHISIEQIIWIQLIFMSILLIAQVKFFIVKS